MISAWASMRFWSARRWMAAILGGVATALLVALPTDVIDNPVFGREIPPTWWALPVVVLTGIFAGLVIATYVRNVDAPAQDGGAGDGADAASAELGDEEPISKWGMAGAFLSYFAVGCPVCNKLVLLALGSSGAITWFAPVQPYLAAASILFLIYALDQRLKGEFACRVR